MRTGSAGDVVRRRIRKVRERRGMTQGDLSRALEQVGVTIHSTAVAKIEKGTRAVTIDEVLALAYVLRVFPVDLLLPSDEADLVEVTPLVSEPAGWIRGWIGGMSVLPSQVSTEREWRRSEEQMFGDAPESVQRSFRAGRHPLMLIIEGELKTFARDGVLLTQGEQTFDVISPPVLADALRGSARKVLAYADLLASDLEGMAVTAPENTDDGPGTRPTP